MNDFFRCQLKEKDHVAFIDSSSKVLRKGRIKVFEGEVAVVKRPNGDIVQRYCKNLIKCPPGHT